LRLRAWLFGHFREVARLFAFAEYDAPVVESAELYTRKAGEQIVEELYTFRDKGDRHLALRPEMTPSLARMILQRGNSLPLPIKWFSIPQCWRYERIQRGRRREHYQWNMDIFGVEEVTAEAEILASLTTFFARLGLGPEDVGIKVSSRKILQTALEKQGFPEEQFAAVCILIDKMEKVPREAVEQEMAALGLGSAFIGQIVELTSLRSLDEVAVALGEEHQGVRDLRQLFSLAEDYGYRPWLQFDVSLVRGLAYYTGMVFEAFDRGASLRAICGGGRYDRLLSAFGGQDIPACGFGFGDAVIVELLKDKGLLPELPAALDDVVFPFDPSLRRAAMQVANQLRARGRSVDLILEDRKMKWAFKHANALGASRLVLLAPDEWAVGKVRLKDLRTGQEQDVILEQL
jgi:histidyl-tRNA synthetase